MYEHRTHGLISRAEFGRRVVRHVMLATVVMFASLALGVIGYHYVADLKWIDALLNASMILTGMGPVDTMVTARAKLFASLYALFSGVVFLGVASVLVAPFAHRLLHRFHLERQREE
ncbi:MAG TPA: hypothetical protein VK850_09540 [Candidatus Binatia bacterium]|nr:hypothetical protein [Candidatus Binatia bacterium]